MLRLRTADIFSRRFSSRNPFRSVFSASLNRKLRGRSFHPGNKTSSVRSLLIRRGSVWMSGPVQRGCPSSPALAARASFCWMWYSWNRIEIRWVIFRYFCRHDSEQLDWRRQHQVKFHPNEAQIFTTFPQNEQQQEADRCVPPALLSFIKTTTCSFTEIKKKWGFT